MLEQFSDEIQN
jgi:hypothetical protein